MEASTLLGYGALASSFVAVYGAVNVLINKASRGARRHRMRGGGKDASYFSYYLRNGFNFTRPCTNFLLANARIKEYIQQAIYVLEDKAQQHAAVRKPVGITPQGLVSCVLVCLAAVFVLVWLITGSVACGIAVPVCICVILVVYVKSCVEKRSFQLRQSIPEALNVMQVCFQAGYSLQQTFEQIASEVDGPLKAIFLQSAHKLQMGATTTQALESLRVQTSIAELSFVAVALDVQHQAGGSMQEVLDSARLMVEGELELSRKLRVQTAQAKLSARVVTIIPFVLIAVFSLISEDFLSPFFESAAGVALLALACGMQILGVCIVRRMLNVKD